PSGHLKEEPFLALLRESLDSEESERVLNVAIEWGRHGEIYSYNYNTGMIHLPEANEVDEAASA
ncbi:MAG: AAA-associated domain-containing protein, partial [Rhodoferax sp.]